MPFVSDLCLCVYSCSFSNHQLHTAIVITWYWLWTSSERNHLLQLLCVREVNHSHYMCTHTGTPAFQFTANLSLSAAHLVQVGSTATGVQLSFSAELVEQTAARAQWSVCMLHRYTVLRICTLELVHLQSFLPLHLLSPPPHPAPVSCLPWLVMAGTTFMKDWYHRMSPLYWGEKTYWCQWVITAASIVKLQVFKSSNPVLHINSNKYPYLNSSSDCRVLLPLCHLQHWQWADGHSGCQQLGHLSTPCQWYCHHWGREGW